MAEKNDQSPQAGSQSEFLSGVQQVLEDKDLNPPPSVEVVPEPEAGSSEQVPSTETPPVVVKPQHGDEREAVDGTQELYVKVKGVGVWFPKREVIDGFGYKRHTERIARQNAEDKLANEKFRAETYVAMSKEQEPKGSQEDDFLSSMQADDTLATTLNKVLDPLKDEIKQLRASQDAVVKQSSLDAGVVKLAERLPGFNMDLVKAEMARMTEEEATKYEHPLGYELLYRRIVERGAGAQLSTPKQSAAAPPAQERVAGPSSNTAGKKPGILRGIDETTAYLNTLESFKT